MFVCQQGKCDSGKFAREDDFGGNVGKRFALEGYHSVLCRRSDEEGLHRRTGLDDVAEGPSSRLGVVEFGEVDGEIIVIDEMLSLVNEDASALGCETEISHVRRILSRGTSAHRQLKDYELERAGGASVEDSLKAVVDPLIADTAEGLNK